MFEFLGKAKHDDCKENVVTRFLGSIRIVITVGSKIIRALVVILSIFLWFDHQFLSSHACYKQYKA